jgi:AcrR family transcriptional regulator
MIRLSRYRSYADWQTSVVATLTGTDHASALAPSPLRADARRNEEALLQAAKLVFARVGVDAPIRLIAAEAGVGLATLYRRFPTRADLVAAVFRREIDTCADAAASLAIARTPADALEAWLRLYTDFLATKQGLAAALHSGDPAFASLPDHFRARFEPALERLLSGAARAGVVRGDIAAQDLLRGIGNLSVASGDGARTHIDQMVDLILDGLKHGARLSPDDPPDPKV